ncbi:MAG: energy-coupling factor transporter transmembrane component T [Geobacteraceae bacterium]|nr:energy-coupling factor transporter transmembrane component T [Geobacteraceae bacterium]
MIRDLLMGRYLPGSSMLHRSDPRTKILLAIVFMVLVFIAEGCLSFLLLLSLTLIISSRVGKPIKHSLKSVKPLLFIAVFMMIVNTFAVKGTPLSDYGIFKHFSQESVALSVRMVLRLFLLLTGASLLMATTTPISLTDGLEALLKPLKRFKMPVNEAAMMISIALRFIPVLLDEAERIFKSQASRCTEVAFGNPLQRARNYLSVLVPLFVGAFRRADDLATAMESRCYQGSAGRTRMKRLVLSCADFTCAAVMLSFSSALICIEYVRS